MIVSIMQPYLFPYIGYFQLLECSDIFVVYDDVQYIKGGWINRNRILVNQAPHWLTLPVESASLELLINQRNYFNTKDEKNKMFKKIESSYCKAPQFKKIYPFILDMMNFNSNNVSDFNVHLIRRLACLLEINCQILLSSELKNNTSTKGQDRVIEINRRLNSSHYINPIGGISLYQEPNFSNHGIKLSFLQPENICYPQFGDSFIPFLSIIDVLMFCPMDEVKRCMKKYRLLKSSETPL